MKSEAKIERLDYWESGSESLGAPAWATGVGLRGWIAAKAPLIQMTGRANFMGPDQSGRGCAH
ncbi:hypothetical protein H663_012935 [Limnohabitans planktonicus II-D5]|uniref:Uncharacterized protein n=1 Tax=Limnohabitans planktonicus II-D5 TaxID=1293045 RepID=A0A2T7UC91_9BURK|nr:hypothetical protein H663_012935 [Limnohabitans planktonicus II-D5]